MTIPELALLPLTPTVRPARQLLIVGPSLGTSVTALWSACARDLAGDYEVVGWDLPGHGDSAPARAPFSIGELASGVLEAVDRFAARRGQHAPTFCYAADSVGGAVGLHLLLDRPERVLSATLLATGAVIGTADAWRERAATVRSEGTAALRASASERWFAAGFAGRDPDAHAALLQCLLGADDESYALTCEALAGYDVRARLGEIRVPLTAVAGSDDPVTPPPSLREIADGVRDGLLVVVEGASHLLPAERPGRVAAAVRRHPELARPRGAAMRRTVLGDAHVDRAAAASTDLTRDFQDFITRYAWGDVWSRPGLDRRTRSLITITALVALGHHEELALHLRAARGNGVTPDELSECLLNAAVYCGVPAANAAFRIAEQVLDEGSN